MQVKSLLVPKALREETDSRLELSRDKGVEIVLLWSADKQGTGDRLRVTKVWLPRQVVGQGFFQIEEEELFQINKELYDRNQILVAQVHTHPTLAFHSQTDDEFAVVNHFGAYSVVVPEFGGESVSNYEHCAYFIRELKRWRHLSKFEARKRIHFES